MTTAPTPHDSHRDAPNPTTANATAAAATAATATPTATMVHTEPQVLTYVREADGLSEEQRAFLAARLVLGSDRAAAKRAGMSDISGTPSVWKRDPVFAAEYERILNARAEELTAWVREEIVKRSLEVPAAMTDLLNATKPIVNKLGIVVGEAPDWQARAKAIEAFQRGRGDWNPERPASSETAGLLDVLGRMIAVTDKALGAGKDAQVGAAPSIIEGAAWPSTADSTAQE